MDFHSLTRRELQALCKKNGIPANITNVAMADALKALDAVQWIEEFSNCSESQTAQSSIESPEKSEVTSPRVPRTRSVRKKVENQTPVNQALCRTRRSTRNLTGGCADRKDSVAPIKIDVQFKEVEKPSVVSGIRKRGAKGESTASRMYGMRRSARLAGKTLEETNVECKEKFETANKQLFSSDSGDNLEMSAKECCTDLIEDTESTATHSGVESKEEFEISSYAEKMLDNCGTEIPSDLRSDSSKDSEKGREEVKTRVTDKQDGVQSNGWNEENKEDFDGEGDNLNDNGEMVIRDEACEVVVKVIGDPKAEICCEILEETMQSELAIRDEITGENADVNKQQEIENDEITGKLGASYGDGACRIVGNAIDDLKAEDDFDKQPEIEINDEVTGESEDFDEERAGTGEMVTGDGVCGVVVNVIDYKNAGNVVPEMNDTASGDNVDVVVEAEDHGRYSAVGNALIVDAFIPKPMEEEVYLLTGAAEEELEEESFSFGDKLPEEAAPNCNSLTLELNVPGTTEEKACYEMTNSSTASAKDAAILTAEHVLAVKESKDDIEAVAEEEEKAQQEEAFSISDDNQAAKMKLKRLDEGECHKPSQENLGGEDASETETAARCLSQISFADDVVALPATPPGPTSGKKKSTSSKNLGITNASLGKENIGEDNSSVVKEEMEQSNKYCDLTDWSLRMLRKELKQLTIASNKKNDNKGNPVKLDEELGRASRPALQKLPENQFFRSPTF